MLDSLWGLQKHNLCTTKTIKSNSGVRFLIELTFKMELCRQNSTSPHFLGLSFFVPSFITHKLLTKSTGQNYTVNLYSSQRLNA